MQNNVDVAENVDGMQMQIPMRTELVELKQRGLLKKEDVYQGFKRTSDVVISAIALAVLSPVMVLTAIAVKLDSKGPAFLVQERIGQNGKTFKMYKYRSMVVGADEILEKYLAENEEARKEYQVYKKLKDDPRVTKIGKFIRKTSIDELPQLVNVLIGNMSLVGPRPYLPREKDDMKHYYNCIIQSKPGITGLWQVSGRSETSFDERLSLDFTYNQTKGMKCDTKILIQTAFKVFKKEGAR